jgi:hypothetical protein
MLKFKEAVQSAKSDAERSSAAAWIAQPPSFIHNDYKSRTFSDINMDLIRTFAELSIYSDILDFNIDEKGLVVSYRKRNGQGTTRPVLDVTKTSMSSPLSLLGGPTLVALHTALVVRPHADCGLQAIARRSFFSSDEHYADQAQKAYERLSSIELDKIYSADPTIMMMLMLMMSGQQNKAQPK